jgi:hypothetical protein
MIGLLTSEEMAALLGDKTAAAKYASQEFSHHGHSQAIIPQTWRSLVSTRPTPSLRELITAEEIAALLECFLLDPWMSQAKRVQKTRLRRK